MSLMHQLSKQKQTLLMALEILKDEVQETKMQFSSDDDEYIDAANLLINIEISMKLVEDLL